MNVLPIRPRPGTGEPWDAYVDRAAHQLGTTSRALADHAGLPHTRRAWTQHVRPDAAYLTAAAEAFRLPVETVEAMQLNRFLNDLVMVDDIDYAAGDARHRVNERLWLLPYSRACPHCLRRDGHWRTAWTLPFSVACVEHNVVLMDRCPRCDGLLRVRDCRARHAYAVPAHRMNASTLDVRRCTGRVRPSPGADQAPCGYLLTAARLRDATAAERDVQTAVDLLLDRQPMHVAGFAATSAEVLDTWRTLTVLHLRLRARSGRTLRQWWREPPACAEQCAVSLHAALSIMREPGAASAAQALQSWFDQTHVKPSRAVLRVEATQHGPIARVIDALLHVADNAASTLGATGAAKVGFSAANVPPRAWPCALPPALTGPRRTGPSKALLLAMLSVAVNTARTGDPSKAAAELGWAADDPLQWKRQLDKLRRHERAAFHAAVQHMTDRLSVATKLPVFAHPPLTGPSTHARLRQAEQPPCRADAAADGTDTDVDAWCPCWDAANIGAESVAGGTATNLMDRCETPGGNVTRQAVAGTSHRTRHTVKMDGAR